MASAATLTTSQVFQIIRTINDPEHPKTLEQLDVVQEQLIKIHDNYIDLTFTPTIPHCSMATLIGLCIRVKLERNLPKQYKFDVSITPGTHSQEQQVTKQLRDKERVSAALENPNLLSLVEKCIEESELNNPVFASANPNASCGNSTGLSPEEQQQHPQEQQSECCGGHGKESSEGGCCQDDKKESSDANTEQNDECCGGNGNNDQCCQSK